MTMGLPSVTQASATPNAVLHWQSGRGYDVASNIDAGVGLLATLALTANTLYAIPLYVPYPITIAKVGINITGAAAAGKLIRSGLYTMDTLANGYQPKSLIVDGGANLAADGTGVKEHTVSVPIAGDTWIYLVTESDGAPTVHSYASQLNNPFGLSAGGAGTCMMWTSAFTFAALPSTFPTPALSSGNVPRVYVIPA